jgi:hypothetical protein
VAVAVEGVVESDGGVVEVGVGRADVREFVVGSAAETVSWQCALGDILVGLLRPGLDLLLQLQFELRIRPPQEIVFQL